MVDINETESQKEETDKELEEEETGDVIIEERATYILQTLKSDESVYENLMDALKSYQIYKTSYQLHKELAKRFPYENLDNLIRLFRKEIAFHRKRLVALMDDADTTLEEMAKKND